MKKKKYLIFPIASHFSIGVVNLLSLYLIELIEDAVVDFKSIRQSTAIPQNLRSLQAGFIGEEQAFQD